MNPDQSNLGPYCLQYKLPYYSADENLRRVYMLCRRVDCKILFHNGKATTTCKVKLFQFGHGPEY